MIIYKRIFKPNIKLLTIYLKKNYFKKSFILFFFLIQVIKLLKSINLHILLLLTLQFLYIPQHITSSFLRFLFPCRRIPRKIRPNRSMLTNHYLFSKFILAPFILQLFDKKKYISKNEKNNNYIFSKKLILLNFQISRTIIFFI